MVRCRWSSTRRRPALGRGRSHEALTYDHGGVVGAWAPSSLEAGQVLRKPASLFKKLDESIVKEEYARLGGQ